MLRFAVVGIGRMGLVHATNLAKGLVEGACLTAVCDVDSVKLNEFKACFPSVNTFKWYEELLKERLDGVIVATPHYSHGEIVSFFLENGVNVLSEKPQCVSVSEAERVNEIASKSDAIYAIMYNQRTNPVYARAKELIENGKLGSLRRAEMVVTHWYRSQRYYDQGGWRASWSGEGGGLLINQCVHQLDILQWLIGMPKRISAKLKTVNRNITVENDVVATLEYENFTCVFIASGHELYGTNRLEIVGERGKIIIDDYRLTFIEYLESETEVNKNVVEGYGETGAKIETLSYEGAYREEDERYGQQLRVVKSFVWAVRSGTPLVADGKEGVNALSLINGIYSAHFLNEKVTLPLNGSEYDALLAKLVEKEKKK